MRVWSRVHCAQSLCLVRARVRVRVRARVRVRVRVRVPGGSPPKTNVLVSRFAL